MTEPEKKSRKDRRKARAPALPGVEGEGLLESMPEGLLVKDDEPDIIVHQRSEYLQRVGLLIRMRWIAIVALMVTTWLAAIIGRFEFDILPPCIVLTVMALLNIAFEIDLYLLDRKRTSKTGIGAIYRSAVVQIDIDLVALTFLIHFTGGVDSPFVLFYIFHTITASYLLSRTETLLHVTLAVGLFATMCYLEYDPVTIEALDIQLLKHVDLYSVFGLSTGGQIENYKNSSYVASVLLGLAVTLYVSAGIGTHLAALYRRNALAIKEQAITDGLTGLFNYRYFTQQLELEFERARRYQHPISLVMVDMDGLKAYNDAHGHLFGSQALKEIAEILKGSTRTTDVVAKYGGDEFSIILPEINKEYASMVAERIRQQVKAHHFLVSDRKRTGELSVSIGVSCFPEDVDAIREMVEKADACLYEAKKAGRNRVKVTGQEGFIGGDVDGQGRH